MRFTLLPAFLLLMLQAATPRNGSIEGTVTRYGSGIPMPDVEILLTGSKGIISWASPQTITDPKGHFLIDDLPAGSYIIRAQRMGYANPAPNGVRVQEGGTTRTVVIAPGEHVENANLSMVIAGAISGRVLDSGGKPVSRDLFLGSTDEVGSRYTTSDDRGEFHIVGIAPGKYVLSMNGDGGSVTFFPGVAVKAAAAVLEITEGSYLAALDFTLLRESADKTFTVSGKAEGFPYVNLLSKGPVPAVDGVGGSFGGGRFLFTRVPPGLYEVYLHYSSTDSLVFDVRKLGVIGRIDVSVVDRDVKDLVIIPGGVNVTGRLIAPTSAMPAVSVRLVMPSKTIHSRDARVDGTGAFTIPNVLSGTWSVEFLDLPANLGLLDVRQGDISVYENGLQIEDRTPEPLQLRLGPAGTIDGIVRDPQSGPLGAGRIALISESADPLRPATLYRTATADGAGHFTFSNVAEGRYRIFAFDSARFPSSAFAESSVLQARDFLVPYEAFGANVPVSSGSRSDVLLAPIREPR